MNIKLKKRRVRKQTIILPLFFLLVYMIIGNVILTDARVEIKNENLVNRDALISHLYDSSLIQYTDKIGLPLNNSFLSSRDDGKFDLDLEKGLETKVEIKGAISNKVVAKIDSIDDPLIFSAVSCTFFG